MRDLAILLVLGIAAFAPRSAAADPLQWHIEAGGAHALGDPQAHEYGYGVVGNLAGELPLGRALGIQLEAGGLWLPHTNRPADPSLADHGDGTAFTAMGGLRAHPFAEVAGFWADANLGYIQTGSLSRFGVDAHLGYDWRVGGGRWDVGPCIGYLEVVQPGDALRPADAHIVSLGIHVAIGAERPHVVLAAPPPAPPPPPPPPPPPGPSDRDHDGVLDPDDACPDVPGVHTDDPKTNGCPPAGDEVRVTQDHIEYDEVILFDTDQAHVHHASWPILKKLATFINANPDIQEVDITGHTDERGTAEHNLNLSRYRAEAVKDLLGRFGVDSNRLTTLGLGYSKPRAEGHSESEWRQNRRVEFIITKVKNVQGGSTTLTPTPQGTPP